jgi:hypothetical protein
VRALGASSPCRDWFEFFLWIWFHFMQTVSLGVLAKRVCMCVCAFATQRKRDRETDRDRGVREVKALSMISGGRRNGIGWSRWTPLFLHLSFYPKICTKILLSILFY